jgi:hypothetical protein
MKVGLRILDLLKQGRNGRLLDHLTFIFDLMHTLRLLFHL